MSRKQVVRPARGNKKNDAERKRDGRAARRAIAKDRKNRPPDADDDGEEFVSFSNQLQSLGLKLREIPGDGNCLFRALGDQLEGHSRGHVSLRLETVQYMKSHRKDFEPFVEDDVPFADHLSNLSQPGTFAGNDAIVAFARSQELKVVIHQLNTPLWEIRGVEKQACREMHIAYRYGDHYDSVRRIGDNSESPAQLRIEGLHSDDATGQQRQFGDGQMTAGSESSPSPHDDDDNVILSTYQHPAVDDEEYLGQLSAATLNAEWLADPEPGSTSACSDPPPPPEGNNAQKAKVSNKLKKEQQRQEKKKRQEERHRQKVLQSRGAPENHNQNQNLVEPVTLVPALNTLSI